MTLLELQAKIPNCTKCPRLVAWTRDVAEAKRKSFQDQHYWGRPVPPYGDAEATGLIVGLAPAAHGANRTGRMFTGDRSGDWLFRAMHRAGLASQPESVSADDGMHLSRAFITACCHCAPPDNKPTPEELLACSHWLNLTLIARPWKAFLCLGGIAWVQTHRALGFRAPKFGHGVVSNLPDGRMAFASYHPSQQNTFTGRLTEQMLDDVMQQFAARLGS